MTTITWYEQGEFRTHTVDELCASLPASIPETAVVWVDMSNPSAEDEHRILTTWLGVHELVLDDMRHNEGLAEGMHPPKVEEFDDYLFLIFHAVPIPERKPDEDVGTFIHRIRGQQINFILTERMIVTHHEVALACVGDVQRSVLKNRMAIERGPDYITALILDEIVDSMNAYNALVEDRIEELERLVMKGESTYTIRRLLDHKNRNQFTRRKLMQHREIVSRLSRGEFKMVGMDEAVYYRNVHDHLVHAVDHVDTIRESILSLIDLYFSMSSTRLNQVMRYLTVISTVFLPITFITSWYGMNFQHMPELDWVFGYPMVITIIVVISIAMFLVFRKRGWLA